MAELPFTNRLSGLGQIEPTPAPSPTPKFSTTAVWYTVIGAVYGLLIATLLNGIGLLPVVRLHIYIPGW
jgi:hypothetical protein